MRDVFYKILFIITLLFFIAPLISNAQALFTSEDISAVITPESPGPNQNVAVQIESFNFDLNKATISWYVNDKLLQSGVGITTFQFTSGALGKTTKLTIIANDGKNRITKNLTFYPAEVNIVWEADSYTPPFYKGKAMYPNQGDIKIVALPNFIDKNGASLSPTKLAYTWKKDGTTLGSQSGYDKQAIVVPGGIMSRPFSVEVSVSSADGTIQAKTSQTFFAQNHKH